VQVGLAGFHAEAGIAPAGSPQSCVGVGIDVFRQREAIAKADCVLG
jgi:hypothetical protein